MFHLALFPERRTRFGRYVYAIGGGEDIAALSGVPVKRTRILAFTLAGFFTSVAAVLAAAQLGQANTTIAEGRLFMTVTAVVVGGTALTGGWGGVANSLVGVLIVAVLANRGLDVGAKEEVYDMIRNPSAEGIAIVLTSDTLEETIGLLPYHSRHARRRDHRSFRRAALCEAGPSRAVGVYGMSAAGGLVRMAGKHP